MKANKTETLVPMYATVFLSPLDGASAYLETPKPHLETPKIDLGIPSLTFDV